MLERPPILQGNANDQVRALHDYLMRLAGVLDTSIQELPTLQSTSISVDKQGRQVLVPGKDKELIEDIRRREAELKALIIKSADEVYRESVGASERTMEEVYLAKSDYGTYEQAIYTRIEETAQQIRESFDFESLTQSVNDLQDYMSIVHGEIRRGFVPNPVSGEDPVSFGIVISTRDVFAESENTWEEEGNVYTEIKASERFGIYTASGWEYWHDGVKQWWFDAEDGMLHARSIGIEDSVQIGAWRLVENGTSFGLKYVGE